MSDTEVLLCMFNHYSFVPIEASYDKDKVILKETQTDGSCIQINNIPEDSIIIDLDRVFDNSNLFNCSQAECKRADYLIISEEKKKVLFIEMKKQRLKKMISSNS
jgi:hypothetical protein